jgi:acetyl/propionyl-CoA carboxylase alpha subunit
MKLFSKILVANRGEIAVRIIRTLRLMGIRSVAIYSLQDKNSLHVRMADEGYYLEGSAIQDTYLLISKIIDIARQSGADAIHPGYGFLSENPDFSRAAAYAGINFIGPTAGMIQLMGDKVSARNTMRELGIPMSEGFEGSHEEILKISGKFSYPILVKAAAGGGGKAMRVVFAEDKLNEALEITSREAKNYFGNDKLFVEQYLQGARHIEVQVLADHYGNIIIAGERECSVQRRYQKVIEESPAASINSATRDELYNSTRKIAQKIGYINAGTIEFLVDNAGNHFFLEMNTRIQVEHAVTEMITGIDIVELQIQIASGNELTLSQNEIQYSGHAIECRLYAEDPENNFRPVPGIIKLYRQPRMPGLRIDSGIDGPDVLHPEYDPLIAKIIFHAHSRDKAIDGLDLALRDFVVLGPKNNREFLREILNDPDFSKNNISTSYLESNLERLNSSLEQKRAVFNKTRLFAAWLACKLNSHPQNGSDSVWNKIGFWRLQMTKSILFNLQKFDIQIEKNSNTSIFFSVGGAHHRIILKSLKPENIIFEFEGTSSSASVSSLLNDEDVVYIDGMEFRISVLDCLPVSPHFIDHAEMAASGTHMIKSPLHGKISQIFAASGNSVKKGDSLFSLDAMKIENKITSFHEGIVNEIYVKAGDQVQINQTIMTIESRI